MTRKFFVASLPVLILAALLGYAAVRPAAVFSAPPAQNPAGTPTPPALNPGDRTYTVAVGDSYWSIAQKMYGNGSKYKLILEANNLTDKSPLRVGSVLIIPGAGEVAPTVAPASVAPATRPSAPAVAPTSIPLLQPTAPPTVPPTSVPTLPPISVVARSQQPGAAGTPADPGGARSPANGPSELRNQQLLTALDILSGIFAATSVICAFLAYQSYNRAKRFERMVIVRRRARSNADFV